MYNMMVYLGKDSKCASPLMTATDASLTRPSTRIENVGQILYGSVISLGI